MTWVDGVYRQVYNDGFLFTKSHLYVSDIASRNIQIPMLQLMKVHPENPIEFSYAGRISVKPYGDKRLIGDIQKDPNKKIHDCVSILFCPPNYKLRNGVENFVVENGYKLPGKNYDLTIGYLEGDEIYICWAGTSNLISHLEPPIIPFHIIDSLLSKPEVIHHNGKSFEVLGKVDLENNILIQTANIIATRLEERFHTKIFIRR